MRQIIFDTETTGLDPRQHRIVSLAAIELVDGEPTGRFAHWHINPERPCDPGAAKVHGLTDEYLAKQATFREIKDEFMDFIRRDELVIHNAAFDIGMLTQELYRLHQRTIASPFVPTAILPQRRCTLQRAEALRGRAKGRNTLDALTVEFGIDNLRARTGKHGALVDCLTLYGVYRALFGLKPRPLVQWEVDHYLSKAFGVHGSFQPTDSRGEGVPAQAEPDAPARTPDTGACSVGAGQDLRGDNPVHHAPAPGRHPAVAAESGSHQSSGRDS